MDTVGDKQWPAAHQGLQGYMSRRTLLDFYGVHVRPCLQSGTWKSGSLVPGSSTGTWGYPKFGTWKQYVYSLILERLVA